MLSKNEESKLDCFFEMLEAAKLPGAIKPHSFNYYDIEWLCRKLKEINEEALGYYKSYFKANEELIARERFGAES